jgi:inhibitor of KinA sporulation pathway (predicted exonuclease)
MFQMTISLEDVFNMKNKVLVVDVEMTCWDEPTDKVSEIIQIGVVEVDMVTLEITRRSMMYVTPVLNDLSDYCMNLTGITKRQVYKQGRPYADVINSLVKRFGLKNKMVFGWGRDDLAFGDDVDQYINLSALYTMLLQTDTKYNLEEALKIEDIEFEGNAHDALVDAENTAKLLIHLFKNNLGS